MLMNYYCLFQDSVYSMGFLPMLPLVKISVYRVAKILLNNIENVVLFTRLGVGTLPVGGRELLHSVDFW